MKVFGSWTKQPVPIGPTDKPKVLIGVAGFEGVRPKAQESFNELAYWSGRKCPEYDFLFKIIIKREQFRARNNLVDLAIVNGCEWFLMLDDDSIVPPNLFQRMVAHNKDVLGALYFQRGGAYHPVLMKRFTKGDGLVGIDFIKHFDKMLVQRGLYQIDGVLGGGCILFKVDVFRKIQQPYFWVDGIVGTDVHICQQLSDAGIPLWVDTNIEIGHLGEEQIVTSRTVPQYAKKSGTVNEELWEDLRAYFDWSNDQLESELYKASEPIARIERWKTKPRETWEAVRDFYQDFGHWHVLNLGRYNLGFDQSRDWCVNAVPNFVKPGAHVVDFGCGLGYCTIPLVRAGISVTAMDLASTPTLEFLRWRLKRHDLKTNIVEFVNPVPPDLDEKADGVVMISVFDHLWDPIGVLDWLDRNVKPRGWLICDTVTNLASEDEPQHLIKYNPHKILREMRSRGWMESPENPIFFVKER